jgi:hypothetical protein
MICERTTQAVLHTIEVSKAKTGVRVPLGAQVFKWSLTATNFYMAVSDLKGLSWKLKSKSSSCPEDLSPTQHL